jgi:hypothetical protein
LFQSFEANDRAYLFSADSRYLAAKEGEEGSPLRFWELQPQKNKAEK